jgi:hypothetical protein
MNYEALCNDELKRRFNVSIDSVNKMHKRKFNVEALTTGGLWFQRSSESKDGVMSMYLVLSNKFFRNSFTRFLKIPSTNILGVNVQVVKTDDSALLTYTFETWSSFYEMLRRLPEEMSGWGFTLILMDSRCLGVSEEFLEYLHYNNGKMRSISGLNDSTRYHQRIVRKALLSFA